MKNTVFWDVTPCESCKNRRFRGMYRLHPQGVKGWPARNNVSSNQQTKHGELRTAAVTDTCPSCFSPLERGFTVDD
jgi:hypothetical protein